jgi:hypothetical protein
MKRPLTTLAIFSLFAIASMMLPRIALAQSELVGTWKLNVEKSKFNPGPAPKSSVLTYEAAGEGLKVTPGQSNKVRFWSVQQRRETFARDRGARLQRKHLQESQ